MARGKSIIHHYLKSPDTEAMIDACEKLGAQINKTDFFIEITGVAGKPQQPRGVIDAGNSGLVLRFISAIVGLIDGRVVVTGDASIRSNRPVGELLSGLSQLGATCFANGNKDYAPLMIQGPISAGDVVINGGDSQPVSALLIVSAFLDNETRITVHNPGEKPWIDVTLAWLDRLGIQYTNENYEHYSVCGGHVIEAFAYTVPGDFSSIAYPVVAALITRSNVIIQNIDWRDSQGDKKVIEVLQKMGANIQITENALHVQPGEKLRGCEIDVNDFIDALPILAVVGCYATGTTILRNAAIARKKESDRLAAMALELVKMGACVIEQEECLIIQAADLHEATVDGHADHRVAMSLAIAALGCQGKSIVNDVFCIRKTYPRFFEDLHALGGRIEVYP